MSEGGRPSRLAASATRGSAPRHLSRPSAGSPAAPVPRGRPDVGPGPRLSPGRGEWTRSRTGPDPWRRRSASLVLRGAAERASHAAAAPEDDLFPALAFAPRFRRATRVAVAVRPASPSLASHAPGKPRDGTMRKNFPPSADACPSTLAPDRGIGDRGPSRRRPRPRPVTGRKPSRPMTGRKPNRPVSGRKTEPAHDGPRDPSGPNRAPRPTRPDPRPRAGPSRTSSCRRDPTACA